MYTNFIFYATGLIIPVLIVFGILQWIGVPTGNFIDWVIGLAIFEWLLVIVTVPWNIHFDAKAVIDGAELSAERGITVDTKQVQYAQGVAKRSFWIAIALHLLSAVGLYALAVAGISAVGYIGSGAALLLTVLRPAVRTYEYLATRLAMIRQEFSYPRQDVVELRSRFEILEETVKRLEEQLNPEDPYSFAGTQRRYWEETRKELAELSAAHRKLQATNQADHERLSREAKNAVAQLSADSQFLDHVREIIRFFKTA